jgi:hypothetical protein
LAFDRCEKAKEIVGQLKDDLKKAEESLKCSQHEYAEIEKESQEILAQIDRVNNDATERGPAK